MSEESEELRTMRRDVTIDEWVAALESGRYRHNIGNLRTEQDGHQTQHCCLGVLLDIAGAQWEHDPCRNYDTQMVCRQIDDTGSIPEDFFRLLGPEIEEVLSRPVDDLERCAQDLLVEVNDDSDEGYVPAIKLLRRLQEECWQ